MSQSRSSHASVTRDTNALSRDVTLQNQNQNQNQKISTTTTVVDLPGGGAPGSSSWSPASVLEAWNTVVPKRMCSGVAPLSVPDSGHDWWAVFAAVSRNKFLCGEGRRLGPVTLPWVLAHPEAALANDPGGEFVETSEPETAPAAVAYGACPDSWCWARVAYLDGAAEEHNSQVPGMPSRPCPGSGKARP